MARPKDAVRTLSERLDHPDEAHRAARSAARALAERFAEALRGFGATRIVLFGSLALGTFGPHSDIDIAVAGVPERILARLEREFTLVARRRIDLTNLDRTQPALRTHVERFGEPL